MNIHHRNARQFNLSIGSRCNLFTCENQLRLEALCEGSRMGGSTHLLNLAYFIECFHWLSQH